MAFGRLRALGAATNFVDLFRYFPPDEIEGKMALYMEINSNANLFQRLAGHNTAGS